MRPLNAAMFMTHAVLAAAITGFAFFSMPVVGMVVHNNPRERLEFQEFGGGGEDRAEVEFTWSPELARVADPFAGPPDGSEQEAETAAVEEVAASAPSLPTPPKAESPVVARAKTGPERAALRTTETMHRPGSHSTAVAAPTKAARSKGKCAEPVEEIQALGSKQWRVERDFVEGYTGSMKRLNTLGAVAQHEDKVTGEADGFLVGRIKCGSPLHQGGLRNGDVVHSVNGHKVNNVLQAVSTYTKVRKKDRIEVEVTRRNGDALTLTYQLY